MSGIITGRIALSGIGSVQCLHGRNGKRVMDPKGKEIKQIVMAEYQGRCDEEGTAVGHAPKVLGEYAAFLRPEYAPRILAPRCVLRACGKAGREGAKVLPHHIVMKAHPSFFEKVANKLRMFANIRIVLKQAGGDTVWFFNTEFYLCLYLALFGNSGKRIVFTSFKEAYDGGRLGGIKQKIFERAQKRMALIISSGEDFRFKNAPSVYLPDYACDEKLFAPYREKERRPNAVCLGTMGAEKQLEEMVRTFTRLGFPLTVAGRFYDRERLKRLKEAAGDNITIRDEYLSREEYLRLLGRASHVVLPYAPEQYGSQTSGVLQEALFLDTVIVAPEKVLKGNHVPGLGFESWDALKAEALYEDTAELRRQYAQLRSGIYSKEHMKKTILECMEDRK